MSILTRQTCRTAMPARADVALATRAARNGCARRHSNKSGLSPRRNEQSTRRRGQTASGKSLGLRDLPRAGGRAEIVSVRTYFATDFKRLRRPHSRRCKNELYQRSYGREIVGSAGRRLQVRDPHGRRAPGGLLQGAGLGRAREFARGGHAEARARERRGGPLRSTRPRRGADARRRHAGLRVGGAVRRLRRPRRRLRRGVVGRRVVVVRRRGDARRAI